MRIRKNRTFSVDGGKPLGTDGSDTLGEQAGGDENAVPARPNLTYGNYTADPGKETVPPLQRAAGFDFWDSGSTAPDDKRLDDAGRFAMEERSQFGEAVESLLQLSLEIIRRLQPTVL